MRILSLYFAHDANLTLFEDGEPIVVLEKERLTRNKHDHGPMDLPVILHEYGWTPESVDWVVYNPYITTQDRDSFRWTVEKSDYREHPDYKKNGWRGPVDDRTSRQRIRLIGRWYDALAVDHHLAHIAGALFTSPFKDAGILSADGGGDHRMCALATGDGNRIDQIEYGWGYENGKYQLNIGSAWASLGEHHFGMKRLEGAGKLMGLSSYGEPRRNMMSALKEQMLNRHNKPLDLTSLGWKNGIRLSPEEPFAQDLCASLQSLTTDLYLEAAERIASWRGVHNLVLTGGCSMNCIANTAVHNSGFFDNTWVPAQPHDGGLSLGQALFLWHHFLDQPRIPRAWSAYLGTDAGDLNESWIPEIVDYLEEGKSVGLCYGRSESGPRALGHRSILLDPRRVDGKEYLNTKVKYREWYRPFAPMVLGDCGVPSKYMSYILPLDENEVPAVTHVDYSARIQTVHQETNEKYFNLIKKFKEKTKCPIIVNTSFNVRGEPIVNTPLDAFNCFT